jgi:polar amino acid transport system permease protein
VSIISTLLFIVLVGFIIVNAPGWQEFQSFFFDPEVFASSWPKIVRAFWINVQMFLVAEVFVLIFGLLLALMRSLPGPVFTPIRGFAIVYVDVMRGLPAILVVYVLGFGMPGLGIEGMPTDEFFWGTLSLVLLYSAYVSEVYRAGINSVHPSQEAAARSLGLSRFSALRYVVVPQAVRRVIPPLLNDFIGLQKDTALVGLLGLVEAFRRADIEAAAAFNFTPYVVTALLFLALTIPLSRFVDWLVARDQRRQLAGVR